MSEQIEVEQPPATGAWLAPAVRLWLTADDLVKYAQLVVLLAAGVGGLLYLGAALERRQLRSHLRVLDGAAAGGDIDLEAADGNRG